MCRTFDQHCIINTTFTWKILFFHSLYTQKRVCCKRLVYAANNSSYIMDLQTTKPWIILQEANLKWPLQLKYLLLEWNNNLFWHSFAFAKVSWKLLKGKIYFALILICILWFITINLTYDCWKPLIGNSWLREPWFYAHSVRCSS